MEITAEDFKHLLYEHELVSEDGKKIIVYLEMPNIVTFEVRRKSYLSQSFDSFDEAIAYYNKH